MRSTKLQAIATALCILTPQGDLLFVGKQNVQGARGGHESGFFSTKLESHSTTKRVPLWRQSPTEIISLWDARTLATFSLSQLDALARIASGHCPLLSRVIQCVYHGGKRRKVAVGLLQHHWRRLALAYLGEEAELARRQSVAMMRHVWTNYEVRAFGRDELRPLTGEGVDSWGGMGQTLVDSLDTLWLMGFRAEFDRAANWVEQSLSFDKNVNVNLFETSIRQLGGLIAAYALSHREGFLAKALDLGNRLILAFGPSLEMAERSGKWSRAGSSGIVADLLRQMGLPQSAMDSILGSNDNGPDIEPATHEVSQLVAPTLPYSDVNLKTGEVQNLASFVSLAEAYVPIEWKALALFTGNCSFVGPQEEVLRIVNRTAELETRGFAPILLKPDGSAFPSHDNRISLGSRGDSFYEYLLKDVVWSGEEAGQLTKRLWRSFRTQLPSLLVEAHPVAAMVAATKSAMPKKKRQKGRRQETSQVPEVPVLSKQHQHGAQPGTGGASGGWFETWRDVAGPWLFLKEVGFSQTIPKMDHLVCFLPGALALDVLHHGAATGEASSYDDEGFSLSVLSNNSMRPERISELLLAHKLAQTCVHMYFRTVSDLAPEITRFNALGLVDDQGSMHNILRPETIESLLLLWRTTKAQIYRNWGQRLLAAFSRMKTRYGYASLHNVNRPWDHRNEMPSFFVAETLKYLFLLFAEDSVLSLHDVVLSTEAHPLPTIDAALLSHGAQWRCGGATARRRSSGRDSIGKPSLAASGITSTASSVPAVQLAETSGGTLTHPSQSPSVGVLQVSPAVATQAAISRETASAADRQEANDAVISVASVLDRVACGRDTLESVRDEEVARLSMLHEACEKREQETAAALIRTVEELGHCNNALASLKSASSESGLSAIPQVQEAQPSSLVSSARVAQVQPLMGGQAAVEAASALTTPARIGDSTCWVGGYVPDLCCWPPPWGNLLCWDAEYTYARCCTDSGIVRNGSEYNATISD